jgi:hypothetical protein
MTRDRGSAVAPDRGDVVGHRLRIVDLSQPSPTGTPSGIAPEATPTTGRRGGAKIQPSPQRKLESHAAGATFHRQGSQLSLR